MFEKFIGSGDFDPHALELGKLTMAGLAVPCAAMLGAAWVLAFFKTTQV